MKKICRREFVVWEIFELAWGVPENEISHFLVFQLFSVIFLLVRLFVVISIFNGRVRSCLGLFLVCPRNGQVA